MSNKGKQSVRLFVEGFEADLEQGESMKNGITYGLANIKNLSQKTSNFSKSITLPGTANNNKLFGLLYNVQSVGATSYTVPTGSAIVSNSVSGLTVISMSVDPLPASIDSAPFVPDQTLGFTFAYPINNGSSQTSYHHSIPNYGFSFITSGSSYQGYVVCKKNGTVISCNKLSTSVSKYYFPQDNYAYDDIIQIDFQPTQEQYSGNIGYAYNPLKLAKCIVLEDNQQIMSGYLKVIGTTSNNYKVKYQVQIISMLGGLLGAMGNSRLEDLFTVTSPDLVNDPYQLLGLTKTIDLPSPYDHQLTLENIAGSWTGETNWIYPLIDYGGNGGKSEDRSDITVNGTNWNTSVFRPCIGMVDYFNLIFASCGYTYDSSFLSSSYAANLICPYKDGNFTCIDNYNVTLTSVGTQEITVPAEAGGGPSGNTFYLYNDVVSDYYNIYNVASSSYSPPYLGTFTVSTEFVATWTCTSPSADKLVNPEFDIFIQYELYASGSPTPYTSSYDLFSVLEGEMIFNEGFNYFIGTGVSNEYQVSFQNTVFYMNQGDTLKININPIAESSPSSPTVVTYLISGSTSSTQTGSAVLSFDTVNIVPYASVQLAPIMDGQYIQFKDFVPKSVKQKDFIQSVIHTFNLYPVQDPLRPNHFQIYTRDEFFNDGDQLDWTSKLDISSDITIKPVAEIDSAKLLFSFKRDKDYWNKYYDGLYGNFSYGSLRITDGYEFSNKEKDVLKDIIFAPTPIVQYDNIEYASEGAIEILNTSDLINFPNEDLSSTWIMASGYYVANGPQTPYDNMPEVPDINRFSGTKFNKARVGVQISYWGNIYTIVQVLNPYTFQVDRSLIRPVTQGSDQRITNVYYCESDGFTYVTNNNLVHPAIYDSSDNNLTHKPAKCEMRLLHFEPINLSETNNQCNPFYLQYTPVVNQNGMYTYFTPSASWSQTNNYVIKKNFPFASHLNSYQFPTKDLLFAPPVELFYNFSGSYPTKNLYTSYWINSVAEIVDPAARMMDASLKLTSTDIGNLSLNDSVMINGTQFRINEIKDYRGDSSKVTKCEFIKQPLYYNVLENPMVDAGGEQFLDIACVGALALNGMVMLDDSLGQKVSSSLWTILTGSGVTINSPSSLATGITVPGGTGSYTFELTVTDNFGLVGTDITTLNIEPHEEFVPTMVLSTVSNFFLPTSTVNVSASYITTYNCTALSQSIWSQISGSTVSISTPTSASTNITGFTVAGGYAFQLLLVDNYGGHASGSIAFTVYPNDNVTVQNFIGSAGITGVTGITLTPSFSTISGRGIYNGNHPGVSSATVTITTNGTIPVGLFAMQYSLNGTLVSSSIATSAATYTFGVSASVSDNINFSLTT